MGMGAGGIPTTDNIPEKTEIFGCPETTDFLKHLILSLVKFHILIEL